MSIPFEAFNSTDFSSAELVIDEEYLSNGAKNSSGDVLSKLMNVGTLGGFRPRKQKNQTKYAYIVLESTGNSVDWIDVVDRENGTVVYYGDNRKPGKQIHETKNKGNVILRDVFAASFNGKRADIPPLFYFESSGGRNRRFVGLLVPGDGKNASLENQLVAIWRTQNGQRYQNYKAIFSILDAASISRRWLSDLICGNGYSSPFAPDAWRHWIDTGIVKAVRSAPIIAYRKKNDQLPDNERDMAILQAIYDYFKNDYMFELCAIKIAEMMDSNIIRIEHTRFYKDGGRDAIGQYRIGNIADGIDVDFALEAKHYKPGNSLTVKELSRVISRIRFRQFAILVTTSYLDLDAYKELKEDGHPVIVVSGGDIVKILYSAGYKTKTEVLTWLSQFESGE